MNRMNREVGGWKSLIAMVGLLFVTAFAMGQDMVSMDGVVKVEGSSKKLSGATVTLYENGSVKNKVITSSNGKFEFNFGYDAVYKVEFKRNGYVTKFIEIDTRNIPPEEKERGNFFINMQMSLFEEVKDLDVSVLDQPIGKFRFDPSANDITHDAAYTSEMQKKIKNLMKEYERKKKEEEERRLEEEEAARLEAERLAEVEGQFNEFRDAGDKAMASNDYGTAVENYQKALDLIPEDGIVKDKLADAKEKFEAQQADAEAAKKAEEERKALEAQYKSLVDEADKSFKGKDYEAAKKKYQEALDVKPDEDYPKSQIVEADRLLAEAQAEADRLAKADEEYNTYLKDADELMAAKDYESALINYQYASEMRPSEKYPKEQMKVAQKALLDAQEEADRLARLDEEYRGILATADKAFKAENWEKAKNTFQKALDLKPDEDYPKGKLAEAEAKLAAIKASEEAEAKLEADYQAAIKAGDKAVSEEAYEDALASYQKAVDLKGTEEYPKTQIEEVNKRIAAAAEEKARLEQLEADYKAAVEKADQLFADKKWQEAVTAYEAAAAIKEDERHPKDQIKIAQENIGKQESYDGFLAAGDQALTSEDYATAKTSFEKALDLFPEEEYPKTKIAEIEKVLGDLAAEEAAAAELKAKYEAAIKEGDKAMKSEDFDAAKTAYQGASDLKPDEEYPKTQLSQIESMLAEQRSAEEAAAALEQDYNDAIAKGDDHMGKKEFQLAITAYQRAVELKGGERYPKDQIKIAEENVTKLAQYDDFVKKADEAMAAKDYGTAKAAYQGASDVFPEEEYPKTQLSNIEKLLSDLAADEEASRKLEEDYLAAMKAGDQSVTAKEYESALSSYKSAAALKPEDEAAKTKIAQVEQVLADLSADADRLAALEEQYNKHVSEGDGLMESKDYAAAILAYQKASDVKPEMSYPKQRIKDAEVAMAEAERLAKEASEQAERDARDREEAERLAAAEAERLAQEEAARLATEKAAQEERDRLAAEEAERLAKEEADRLANEARAKEEADRLAAAEAERLANEEAARLAREEEQRLERERLAAEEADRLAREEAERKAREEAMSAGSGSASKYFGVRADGHDEVDAERFMADALAEDERMKYERIQKLKQQQDGWNENLVDEDKRQYDVANDSILEVKDYASEVAQGENSSREENAVAIVDFKSNIEDWDGDLVVGARDDRVEIKQQLNDAEIARQDLFAGKDQQRIENAGDVAEYKRSLDDWDQDISGASRELILENKDRIDNDTYERTEYLLNKDGKWRENHEEIVEYKGDLDGWDSDLQANGNDARIERKQQISDETEAQATLFQDKDGAYNENNEDIVELKGTIEGWNGDLETTSNDARVAHRETLVEEEDARGELFAQADVPRQENVEERAAYKASVSEWGGDLEGNAAESRLEAKQQIDEATTAQGELLADKDGAYVENNDAIVEVKESIDGWGSELSTDAKTQREEVKTQLNEEELARSEQVDTYEEPRRENAEQVVEFKEVLDNKETERVQNSSAVISENYEGTEQMKENASLVAQGENSSLEENAERIDATEEALAETESERVKAAAEDRKETKEKLDAIEYNMPKEYDDYYLSELADKYPEGVTEESYTQPNKIIIRRVVVRGNKADDYHKVIAKWGTFYFHNGRSISEYVWKQQTVFAE